MEPGFYCDDMRHLVCVPYSIEGLHKMAEALNIKRCWYHASRYPHYDIPKQRVAEIKSRCIFVEARQILEICKSDFQTRM